MCTLSLYDVIGITRHLHIKLNSFSNIAQPLHKDAEQGCSFLYIIAKKSVIMSEAFLVDVSIFYNNCKQNMTSLSLLAARTVVPYGIFVHLQINMGILCTLW